MIHKHKTSGWYATPLYPNFIGIIAKWIFIDTNERFVLAALLLHDSDGKVVVDMTTESESESDDEGDEIILQSQPNIKTNRFYS